jgi:hypothetical protein
MGMWRPARLGFVRPRNIQADLDKPDLLSPALRLPGPTSQSKLMIYFERI